MDLIFHMPKTKLLVFPLSPDSLPFLPHLGNDFTVYPVAQTKNMGVILNSSFVYFPQPLYQQVLPTLSPKYILNHSTSLQPCCCHSRSYNHDFSRAPAPASCFHSFLLSQQFIPHTTQLRILDWLFGCCRRLSPASQDVQRHPWLPGMEELLASQQNYWLPPTRCQQYTPVVTTKSLQILTDVPWGAKPPAAENHCHSQNNIYFKE